MIKRILYILVIVAMGLLILSTTWGAYLFMIEYSINYTQPIFYLFLGLIIMLWCIYGFMINDVLF